MFVAVASRTTLTVSIHKGGCRHLNTRTDYGIIGRNADLDRLKEIALEVYDPSCVADVKFRKSGCMCAGA